MKKLLFIIVLALVGMTDAFAQDYDYEINGIYYKVTDEVDQTVKVVSNPNAGGYQGEITIPDIFYVSIGAMGSKAWYVTEIGNRAFSQCAELTKVIMPNTIKTIDEYAFYRCEKLTYVLIPESVTEIKEHAFYGCKNAEIHYKTSNNAFERTDYVFTGCTNATLYYEGSDDLGGQNMAFSNLGTSDIPNYVLIPATETSLGVNTFAGCENMKSLSIPAESKISKINPSVFRSCTSLASLQIKCGNYTSQGNMLFEWTDDSRRELRLVCATPSPSTTKIPSTLPKGTLKASIPVTEIGDDAFYEYSAISSVYIPETIKKIGSYAFGKHQEMIVCLSDKLESVGSADVNDNIFVLAKTNAIEALKSKWGTKYIYIPMGAESDEDVNHDGKVNATDVMQIYNYILSH